MRRLVVVLIAVAFVAGACGGLDDPSLDMPPNGVEGPGIRVVAPIDESVLPAGSVLVQVWVEGFSVVDKLGEAPASGEGHVHFYLDVEVPTAPGEPAVTEEGTYHAGATMVHTWEDVGPGEHTFAAQLVNNDHTPLDPPVVAQSTVTLE